MDTVESPGIRKQIILSTSEYTRILKSPVRVSLNIVSIDPDFGNSNRPHQTMGVLLEGAFRSNFANRLPPNFLNERLFDFEERGDFTRMLVISDGDVARNEVSPDGSRFRELGWDPVLKRRLYGNKEFLVNAMNYLLGDANLINVRSRSVKVRKLDDERIGAERQFWQVLNIGLPVVATILFGIIQWFWRRRRFAKE
jgi:gliding-associated putative ABC transporter substrate-binding component GldG